MPAARKQVSMMPPGERQQRRAAVGVGLDWDVVPDGLPAAGRAEWQHLAVQHRAFPQRIRETDRGALIAYCTWFAAFDAARRDIAERGALVPGRSSADAARGEAGLVKNPSVAAMRDASQQLRYWARELALTPDARARQGLQVEEPEDDDPEGIWD